MRLVPALLCLGVLFGAPLAHATGYTVKNRRIEPNQPLAVALQQAGLPPEHVSAVVSALEGVFDFRKSRVGDQFRLVLRAGRVRLLRLPPEHRGRVAGAPRGRPLRRQQARQSRWRSRSRSCRLEINTSLYEAALAAGEDPVIAHGARGRVRLGHRLLPDVRKGDRARALVEKFVSKGRILRYGEVLAAAYEGSSVGTKRVFRYLLPDGEAGYFQEDGESARKSLPQEPAQVRPRDERLRQPLPPGAPVREGPQRRGLRRRAWAPPCGRWPMAR